MGDGVFGTRKGLRPIGLCVGNRQRTRPRWWGRDGFGAVDLGHQLDRYESVYLYRTGANGTQELWLRYPDGRLPVRLAASATVTTGYGKQQLLYEDGGIIPTFFITDRVVAKIWIAISDRSGLTAGLSQAMAGCGIRWHTHDPGVVLTHLAVAIADGADCLSDMAVLREQTELFGPVASRPTAWRAVAAVASIASDSGRGRSREGTGVDGGRAQL